MPKPGSTVTGADISKLPLAMPSKANGFRLLLDNSFSKLHITMKVDYEIDSLLNLRALTVAGLVYTIQPYAPMNEWVNSGEVGYWRIVEPCLKRRLLLATSNKRIATPVTRTVSAMIRSIGVQMYSSSEFHPPA